MNTTHLIKRTTLVVLLSISPNIVADTIVTDRPDFTESARTVTPGKIQTEVGYTFSNSGISQEQTLGEILLRLPIIEGLEARIGLNSMVFSANGSTKTSGLQDSFIGIKKKLRTTQDAWIPETSFIFATTLPTGGNGYRNNTLQPGVKLLLGWTLSEKMALSSNLNMDRASVNNSDFNQFSESLSLGYSLTEKWGTYVEAYTFHSNSTLGNNASFLNGGLTYLISDDFQLDVRVGTGLNGIQDEHFIGLGSSNRFKL